MELRQLKNFLAVAEQGNISKAADLLRLAQPALSRQIRALEDELHVTLFERHAWGVVPTSDGVILARHARDILRRAQDARDALARSAGVPTGGVAVGVPSSLAATIIPAIARAGRQYYPNISLQLVEGYSQPLLRRTFTGELDMSIIDKDTNLDTLVTKSLVSEPLVAVADPTKFQEGARAISIAEFCTLDLILPSRSNRMRRILEEAAIGGGVRIAHKLEVDSIAAVLEMVAEGVGASILPVSAARKSIEQGSISFLPFGEAPLRRELLLARRADRQGTPALRAVERMIDQIVIEMAPTVGWTVADDRLELFDAN